MKKWLTFGLLIFSLSMLPSVMAAPQPLSPEQAFALTASARDAQTIVIDWKIAPHYYLYRDRIQVSPAQAHVDRLGQPIFPVTTTTKNFPGIGKLAVYFGHLQIAVPVIQNNQNQMPIRVTYQGCSEYGYCYPPTTKIIALNLAGNYGAVEKPLEIDIPDVSTPTTNAVVNAQTQVTQLLQHANLLITLLSFFGFGLLLSLTPCVLPMIPILSSIIVGQNRRSAKHSFLLSCIYVLGVAITYALAGIAVGALGSSIQAWLQQPWIIAIFSLIFILMAMSLFGFYSLQLPESWQAHLHHLSQKHSNQHYISTFIMGCLSTLIVSPCVTAPLVGVLSYIGQQGSAMLGGLALFFLAIGMSAPLLIIGAASNRWLPKAGVWLNTIKNFMGVLMLAVAIWMLERILAPIITMLLWSALFIGTSIGCDVFLSTRTRWQHIKKIVGVIFLLYGLLLAFNAGMQQTNPWQPLAVFWHSAAQKTNFSFTVINNLDELNAQLAQAQTKHQFTVVDFYADWCASCKEMDSHTFSDPSVQQALKVYQRLRVDLTQMTPEKTALMKKFGVIAPPVLLFFNANGQEVKNSRVVGEIAPKLLLHQLP